MQSKTFRTSAGVCHLCGLVVGGLKALDGDLSEHMGLQGLVGQVAVIDDGWKRDGDRQESSYGYLKFTGSKVKGGVEGGLGPKIGHHKIPTVVAISFGNDNVVFCKSRWLSS